MDIQQLIKERYKQLPIDMQQAIKNTDLAGKFTRIADKHSLHIDQNGSLQTETLLVMLGLESSEDYIDNLEKELEISRNEAQAIANDVNNEILNSIKTSLRTLQETNEGQPQTTSSATSPTTPPPPNLPTNSNLSPIEKAGGFTIEMQKPSSSPIYNDSNLKRDEVLNDLENIEKLKPSNAIAFVDHLLANPVSHEQKIEIKKPTTPSTPTKPSVDPYREQI